MTVEQKPSSQQILPSNTTTEHRHSVLHATTTHLSLDPLRSGEKHGLKNPSPASASNNAEETSFFMACGLLMKSSLGMGFLYMPCTLGRLGWLKGSVLLFAIAAICTSSLYLFGRCCLLFYEKEREKVDDKKTARPQEPQVNTVLQFLYSQLGKVAFGNAGQILVLLLTILNLVALLITFTSSIGKYLSFVNFLDGMFFKSNPSVVIIGCSLVLLTPVCIWMKDLGGLSKLNVAGLFSMAFIIILTLIRMSSNLIYKVDALKTPVLSPNLSSKSTWMNVMSAIATTVLSFSNHVTLIFIMPRLVDSKSGHARVSPTWIILTAQLGTTIIYFVTTLITILGRKAEGGPAALISRDYTLLEYDALSVSSSIWPFLYDIANIAMVLNILLSYPLTLDFCRKAMAQLIHIIHDQRRKKSTSTAPLSPNVIYYSTTISLLAVSTIAGAFLYNQISGILTVSAPVTSACLSYIFPSSIYLKMTLGKTRRSNRMHIERIMAVCVLLFGLGLLIGGSTMNIQKLIKK